MANDARDLIRQGLAHDRAGCPGEAVPFYRQALAIEPDNPDAMYLLGLALFESGDAAAGREYVELAVRTRPTNAIFCSGYASIASSAGDLGLAESYFRRAIDLQPDYADAWLGLSGTIRATSGDDLLGEIEQLLAETGRSDRERALLHFAAGKLADDIDDPDRAFGHYTHANRYAAPPFDRDAHRAGTSDILRVFTNDLFEQMAGAGSDSDEMIFIVGMPRSGTTLIEQIIGNHPQVYPGGERQDIRLIAGRLPQHDAGGRLYPACVPHIGAEVFRGFAGSCLAKLRRRDAGAVRFVNKNPLNFSDLGLIALLFPRARIVHCRRNPVDTCLSCYFQYFERVDFAFDLADIAAVYHDYRRLMDHWRTHLPLPILDVDYEDVVADCEAQSRRLVEFCGLGWDDACLDFRNSANPVRTASKWQVRQPIYRTSVERSRRYEAHIRPLLEGLSPYLERD